MAPIYLAQKSVNANTGPNILKARGISGYTPSTLSSLAILGIPHVREIAYDGYYRNVDAFIAATIKGARVFCDCAGYFVEFKSTRPVHLGSIDVSYVPKMAVPPVQEDSFKDRITATSTQRIGKTLVYTVKHPTDQILQGLVKTCNETFAAGPDAVTPIGYKAFVFVRDAITEFLAVHSYSAFSDKDLEKEGTSDLLALRCLKRTAPAEVFGISKKTRWDYIGMSGEVSMPYWDDKVDERPEGLDEDGGKKWEDARDKTREGIFINNVRAAVLKAKPSPSLPTNNYGSSSQIPAMPGLAFPYIAGMNTPDPLIFKTVTSQFFLRLMGSTTNEIQTRYVALRRGFNSLATTEVGKVLAHILAGVKLAMESQARLYVIYDSEYRGFCLLGTGFTIIDGAQTVTPIGAELLKADLSCFNPHMQGLQGVLEALNELMAKGCIVREDIFTMEEIDTEVKLIEALEKITVKDDDEVGDIETKLNKFLKFVCYSPAFEYTRIDPTAIKGLVTSLVAHLQGSSVKIVPCKFTTYDAPYKNVMYRILCRFGTEAPSPWNASGSEITIAPGTETEETPEAEGSSRKKQKLNTSTKFKNMPSTLIFAPKPILIAFKDWERVIEKRCIKMDMKERARQYRCCEVKAEVMVKEIWSELVDLGMFVKEKEPKKDKGKGRAKGAVEIKSMDDLLAHF